MKAGRKIDGTSIPIISGPEFTKRDLRYESILLKLCRGRTGKRGRRRAGNTIGSGPFRPFLVRNSQREWHKDCDATLKLTVHFDVTYIREFLDVVNMNEI